VEDSVPNPRQPLDHVSVERPDIRGLASVVLRKSGGITTFVRGPRHSAPLGDTPRSSSNRDFSANSQGPRNSPADDTNPSKKNGSSVTTPRRNLRRLHRLRGQLDLTAAHPFRLSVLGFRRRVLASPGLPACGLPSTNFALASSILAVTLVPLPRDVSVSAPFTQTQARSRTSDSGTAAVVWFIVVGAHGSSVFLPREARGECL
jgi:hypothetical protein